MIHSCQTADSIWHPQELYAALHSPLSLFHLPRFARNSTHAQKAPQYLKDESNQAASSQTWSRLMSAYGLSKDHNDNDEGFCLITGLSTEGSPLNISHTMPGATPSAVVSLPVDIGLCYSLSYRLLNPNGFGTNRTRQNVHPGICRLALSFLVTTNLRALYI